MTDFSLEGKVAMITGTSRGIGRAIALRLAQAGCFDIILTANLNDALENALRTLPASEWAVLCHGQTFTQVIAAALSQRAPRVKAIKLRVP